jgi:hypothetical protein
MEIEQLRKEINELLENVVEHSNSYSGNRQIPSLEISFVLTKINKMQELLIILKHLLKENERNIKQQKKIEKEGRSIIQEEVVMEIVPEKEELIQPTIADVEVTQEKVTPAVKDFERHPIPKLIDALSLNDRYLYANELFNKEMGAFNEMIKTIDNCNSLEEANKILTKIETELAWDNESTHVLSFRTLVERRFL